MRRPFAALSLGLLIATAPPRATIARTPTPILVELFTSEGCSSCPPADTLLERLIETQPIAGAEIIGLGEHVDYWDHLGWRDRFSSAAITQRQERYSSRLKVDAIYTPQMVVDGQAELVGSDAKAAREAIERALSLPHAEISVVAESLSANRIDVSVSVTGFPKLSRGERADVVVAITEEGLRSEVRAGENHGRTLTHRAIVRRLSTIGEVTADGATRARLPLAAEWQRRNVKVVAFVQEKSSRRVLGASVAALR